MVVVEEDLVDVGVFDVVVDVLDVFVLDNDRDVVEGVVVVVRLVVFGLEFVLELYVDFDCFEGVGGCYGFVGGDFVCYEGVLGWEGIC